jgi:hypothetical protein
MAKERLDFGFASFAGHLVDVALQVDEADIRIANSQAGGVRGGGGREIGTPAFQRVDDLAAEALGVAFGCADACLVENPSWRRQSPTPA